MRPRPETVARLIRDAAGTNRHAAFGVKERGAWRLVPWTEVDRRTREVGNGLLALGVGRGDRVALLSETRLEWTLCDYAILCIGAVTVPVYPTASTRDVAHILRDAGVTAVFCENAAQAAKVREAAGELAALRHVVVIDDPDRGPAGEREGGAGPTPTTLDRLAAIGVAHAASHHDAFDLAVDAVRPDDPASFVYTSGTTGPAKGCIHLHRNWTAVTRSVLEVPDLVPAGDRVILFLPLAHIFARLLQFAAAVGDLTLYYAESIPKVADNIVEVRPHLLPTVPRVLEKIHAAVQANLAAATGPRGRLAAWALGVGRRVSSLRRTGRPIPLSLQAQHALADRLVFAKIKARLGGEVRYVICGGAPLAKEIIEFFHAVDILVLEGYALTESTMATTINRPHRYRLGTVGPALPYWELRLAADGEIECRGPGVFAGYHGDPEATAATMRDGGWLATGDVGTLDADGFLSITDRKKDLIVTAGGKNVAPQNIENLLKARPGVSQAVVVGDRRPFLTALVTLDREELERVAPGADPGDAATRAIVQRYVDDLNRELSGHEQIRRFAILPQDFSQETGELTPTLKVKRRLIAERHGDEIERLYSTDGARPHEGVGTAR